MKAIWVLTSREFLRFWRQPMRFFGTLMQPVLFWLFLSAGFSEVFHLPEQQINYTEFSYPGMILMLLLFSAIFSTITLIEDRNAGFLQGVVVAPISNVSIVVGKIFGGAAIAMAQVILLLFFYPLAGFILSWHSVILIISFCFVICVGFCAMGFVVAWRTNTVASYHSIMSIVFIPMWLLSGALFPLDTATKWLFWIMQLNPITYAMNGLRVIFYLQPDNLLYDDTFILGFIVTFVWSFAMIVTSVFSLGRLAK